MADYFKNSGALEMISYGHSLSRLLKDTPFGFQDASEQTMDQRRELIRQAKTAQEKLVFFFETDHDGKSSPLKHFICIKNESTRISVPRASILSLLAYRTSQGDEFIGLNYLTTSCSFVDGSNSLIDYRELTAQMLVDDGILRLADSSSSIGLCPHVGLGSRFGSVLFGGKSAVMPLITEQHIDRLKAKRREEAQKKAKSKNKIHQNPNSLKNINDKTDLRTFVSKIPVYTPSQLYDKLSERGYVGQARARKGVCLAVYRFISRLNKIHLENIPVADVPVIGGILLRGQTGTGKTLMLKLLAEICGLPVEIVDITSFSETGYVGNEVNTILSRCFQLSNRNLAVAQACSIIAIDEIDKLAETNIGNAHVSRQGVQRSLLKLLEGSIVDTPIDPTDHPFRSKQVRFDTSGILWFGIGAFSGWDLLVGKPSKMGFAIKDEQQEKLSGARGMESYGIMAELIGRFTGGIISFQPLSRREMTWILSANVIPKYQHECRLNGINLSVDEAVFDLLVETALKQNTGARGLTAALEGHLSDILFQAYSSIGVKQARLVVRDGQIRGELKMADEQNKQDKQAMRDVREEIDDADYTPVQINAPEKPIPAS